MTAAVEARTQHGEQRSPLLALDDGDLEFVTRLVLASGSLKELGQFYGVSYPTIRARLDRLIDRLRSELDKRQRDPMSDLLADCVERGELTLTAARAIQKLHRERLQLDEAERG